MPCTPHGTRTHRHLAVTSLRLPRPNNIPSRSGAVVISCTAQRARSRWNKNNDAPHGKRLGAKGNDRGLTWGHVVGGACFIPRLYIVQYAEPLQSPVAKDSGK